MALAEINRLKKKSDIDHVFKRGAATKGNLLFIKSIINDLHVSRFAYMVSSKKYKKAVDRNRIKRKISETIKPLLKTKNSKTRDYLVMIKNKGEVEDIVNELKELIKNIK